jgi:hypothetical protein
MCVMHEMSLNQTRMMTNCKCDGTLYIIAHVSYSKPYVFFFFILPLGRSLINVRNDPVPRTFTRLILFFLPSTLNEQKRFYFLAGKCFKKNTKWTFSTFSITNFPMRDFLYLIVLWVSFVISFPRRGLSCGVFSLYLEEREEWIIGYVV